MNNIPASLLSDVAKLKSRNIPGKKVVDPKTPGSTVVKGPAPENAFIHESTLKRVSHLNQQKRNAEEISFVYEGSAQETAEPPVETNLRLVLPKVDETHESSNKHIVLQPSSRKDVCILKNTMLKLLSEIGKSELTEYPTDMHAFLDIIQKEQKIYDSVFEEVIRQITVNMVERGDILAEIRKRYSTMFVKVPLHVQNLHTELVAQRKLNRRLTEELFRSKESIASLLKELDQVKKHDREMTRQAHDAQEKLVSVLTHSDNTDEILEEYHKLYRLQLDRIEENARLTEVEKKIWMDAATHLALRLSSSDGMSSLSELQKLENTRMTSTNHIIVRVSTINSNDLAIVEEKMNTWLRMIIKISQSVVDEDLQSLDILVKIRKEMTVLGANLTAGSAANKIEEDHPKLVVFQLHDVSGVTENLKRWSEAASIVALRFTGGRDVGYQEEILRIRMSVDNWVQSGFVLLRNNEKNANGKEYTPLIETMSTIMADTDEWLTKLDHRVAGEKGVASSSIGILNQLEDRYATFSARDTRKVLPQAERDMLKITISNWIDQLSELIGVISETAEKDQELIPVACETWLAKISDQLNTDTDMRTEENHKLHNSMINWMVQLLVKSGKETPTEEWDQEFQQVNQELLSFNMNLLRDSVDIEAVSDEKHDLRKIMQDSCFWWLNVAQKLLQVEKDNAIKLFARLNLPAFQLSDVAVTTSETEEKAETPINVLVETVAQEPKIEGLTT